MGSGSTTGEKDTCTNCKRKPKVEGFSWCQPCYEKKAMPKEGEPACKLCPRRAYYNKQLGEYSELCTRHYADTIGTEQNIQQ